ncbi:MAG TPA: hypothetical protein VMM60_16210 [Ilumatobacter sp.]|nr:hypothetical protein [Ilumatobacter sp.]
MGPEILIPVLLLVVTVPLVSWWAKKRFKDGVVDHAPIVAPSSRLTSNALRALESPPWRVVYEIAPEKMSGIEHVVIGPAGAFAIVTVLDPLPALVDPGDADTPGGVGASEPDAHALARVAITRGGLDDALRRCALTSAGLVRVHWGPTVAGSPHSVNVMHGVTAVDGRQIQDWAVDLAGRAGDAGLAASQVDLAWQTVLTSIGRPDPLA